MAKAKRVGRAKILNFVFPYDARVEPLPEQGMAVRAALETYGLNPDTHIYRGIDTNDVSKVRRQGTDRERNSSATPDQPDLERDLKHLGLEPQAYVWASPAEALLAKHETDNPIWYANGNPEGTPLLLVYAASETLPIGDVLQNYGSEPLYLFRRRPKDALKATFSWKGTSRKQKASANLARYRKIDLEALAKKHGFA